MINISGFGLSAIVVATKTFPQGFTAVDFADDADPLDSPDFTAADTGFGLNGDMLVWSRANGIEISVNVIPTSETDTNFEIVLDANRVGKNKSSAQDKVNIVFNYPNGDRVTCSEGTIISGPMMPSVATIGRLKSKMYRFRFERITKTKATAAA